MNIILIVIHESDLVQLKVSKYILLFMAQFCKDFKCDSISVPFHFVSDQYGFQTNNDNNGECKSNSVQGSPTKKVMSSYEEKASILRSEEQKGQKFDVGVEILKTSVKRDGDDEGLLLPTSDKSDSLSLDEVCGSSSSYSDSKTLINDSSREGTLMESSAEDAAKLTGKHLNCSEN